MADNSPATCFEVGLSCENCTTETARQLAAVCKGLQGKMIGQLFVQIYPSSGCAPMHRRFAARYREAEVSLAAEQVSGAPRLSVSAGGRLHGTERPFSERREVMGERLNVSRAVA